jgi:rsbT co-antagonist protein RsbR
LTRGYRDKDPVIQQSAAQRVGDGPMVQTDVLVKLVQHFNSERVVICEDWASRLAEEQLLKPIRRDQLLTDLAILFDRYLEALRTGEAAGLHAYMQQMSAGYMARGVELHEIVGLVVALREILDRSLRRGYGAQGPPDSVFDSFARTTTRVKLELVASFMRERERMIREQQAAIRELSTPVLRVRDRLLILPIIGPINSSRARQLTEQLLMGIRNYRAKVAVIDITGVPVMDGTVANHLVQAVGAARLLGATVITSGLAPEIAQTLVQIGIDLTGLRTVGDLQGGIEEADRLLGYEVIAGEGPDQPQG